MQKILITSLVLLFATGTGYAVELDQDANSAVDITYGGTNAATAADARSNLNVYSTTETDTEVSNSSVAGVSLAGTTLTITLGDASTRTVDLATLQDGIGTDNQTVTDLSLSGNILSITLEDGNTATVDLSAIAGGASAIDDLADVDTTGKAEGKVLKFDASGNLIVGDDEIGATGTGDITEVTAGTGLDGGGLTGAVTLSLADTTATPGSYTNADITVDAQGRVTAVSNGTDDDDQTASEVTIADAGSIITATNVEDALQENRTAIDLNTAKNTYPSEDATKLSGIAEGATANSTDAVLLARSNHTGTQLMSTISDAGTAAIVDVGTAEGEVIVWVGVCSNGTDDNQTDCETNLGTWGVGLPNVICNPDNDTCDGVNDLISAAEVDTRIANNTWTDDQTATEVSITDIGGIITATNVEDALQENRTAIDLNTAKVGVTVEEQNVNADWDASSGDALILNKPTIPTAVSDLTNDSGFITGYTETDPTVNALATATLSCSSDQIPKWNGSVWACSDDTGGSVDLTAPGPIGSVTPDTGEFTTLVADSFDFGTPATGETGEIGLQEDPTNGTNVFTLKAPDSLAADVTLILPIEDGAAGESLVTDGAGNLSFVANTLTEAEVDSYADDNGYLTSYTETDPSVDTSTEIVTIINTTPSTLISETAIESTIARDTEVTLAPVTAPSTAADTCTAGTWAYDASYIYICTATDTWLRASIATW